MKKLNKVLVVVALGMAASGAAQAQATATTTFQVTANVTAACTVAATNLAFGAYSATVGPVDTTSTITITCSNGKGWTLDIGGANNAARTMAGPTAVTLDYGMYNDFARSIAFPSTTGTGTGAAQAVTVFGRIPGAQFVPVGNYADTVNVTVTY